MATLPAKLTLDWMVNRAKILLIGAELKWRIVAWHNVVFVKISGLWTARETEDYVKRVSEIPGALGLHCGTTYVLFEISDMTFRPEEARRYLHADWLKALGQAHLSLGIVEASAPRRQMWRSLHIAMGKQDRVRFFSATDQALSWVRENLVATGSSHG